MRRQRNWSQKKTPEKINETEIYNLPDKEFKSLVIRTLTELGKRIDEHSENLNKELEETEPQKHPLRTEEYSN